MTHSGSEYGIILEGRCGATVGDDYYELETGDSIAFDSRTPHRIWNLNDDRRWSRSGPWSAATGTRASASPASAARPSEVRPGRLGAARAGCGRHETPGT